MHSCCIATFFRCFVCCSIASFRMNVNHLCPLCVKSFLHRPYITTTLQQWRPGGQMASMDVKARVRKQKRAGAVVIGGEQKSFILTNTGSRMELESNRTNKKQHKKLDEGPHKLTVPPSRAEWQVRIFRGLASVLCNASRWSRFGGSVPFLCVCVCACPFVRYRPSGGPIYPLN